MFFSQKWKSCPLHSISFKTATTNIDWLLPTYWLNSSHFNNGKIDVKNVSLAGFKQCHFYMFTYPIFLISYVYTILYTIYCILPSLCNTCITGQFKQCHFYMFANPTLLISYVYTVLDTIYCILPMPFCTITHSYIFMYIFFISLHLCV